LGLAAHSAFVSSHQSQMGDSAAICLVLGGSMLFTGIAFFAARRVRQRPLWVIPAPVAPTLPLIPVAWAFSCAPGLPRSRRSSGSEPFFHALSRATTRAARPVAREGTDTQT
jgi:hypothetical protein